tara:strand:+ start:10219 stop:10497 length:279 start_codon:yes stop_codon:yes gene_type:complete
MYFSIVVGMLYITTDNIKSGVVLTEIAAYEMVGTEDGGILSISLKGNHEELVYHCKGKTSWDMALKWFEDYNNEISEGITQSIKKESKKTRF